MQCTSRLFVFTALIRSEAKSLTKRSVMIRGANRITFAAGALAALIGVSGCAPQQPPNPSLQTEEAILELGRQMKEVQAEVKALKSQMFAATAAPAGAPPSNAVPGLTNVGYTDISCRPKLDGGIPSDSKMLPLRGYKASDTAGEVLPKRPDCQPLAPFTRLVLENSAFVTSGGYSNSVGVANALLPSTQLSTVATTSYYLGVGYSKKPFLKQLRALLYPADSREAISQQGTFWEDFVWNAITMDASYSWGRQLQVKNGTASESFNTRPYYSISGTYTLDLEKMWIYARHWGYPDTRPADQGWYLGPKDEEYFKDPGERRGRLGPADYSWSDPPPTR